jgi:hypothetical protein
LCITRRTTSSADSANLGSHRLCSHWKAVGARRYGDTRFTTAHSECDSAGKDDCVSCVSISDVWHR